MSDEAFRVTGHEMVKMRPRAFHRVSSRPDTNVVDEAHETWAAIITLQRLIRPDYDGGSPSHHKGRRLREVFARNADNRQRPRLSSPTASLFNRS